MAFPLAYLITWRCYGTWLHGEDGAVDRNYNDRGAPTRPKSDMLAAQERLDMRYPPALLTALQREQVSQTIAEVAEWKGWTLLACNVRTNHVHVVVAAEEKPEFIMTTFKSWCTRRMREAGLVEPGRPLWARHGSTPHLWDEESVARARWYVTDMQNLDKSQE